MRSNIALSKQSFASSFALLVVLTIAPAIIRAQDRAPQIVSQPEFKLAPDAIAAGIDGLLGVSLTIDKTGKVEKVTVHGGPGWPCNSSRPAGIEAVREAVK